MELKLGFCVCVELGKVSKWAGKKQDFYEKFRENAVLARSIFISCFFEKKCLLKKFSILWIETKVILRKEDNNKVKKRT